ncbi:hypothetical protein NC652_019220 [Populus alba x Populus x berolinensis]|uniref:Uncharacterized protein n=1 Tax=Populus alba x Populus x berolinensis TaxID=444605 RepID=A0AAD6QI50_9ROSI|nr:hypothetical protein NC652_019220 [Populus alba x Populus x berolinensis]KAJ6990695.1 hypothetical protein NC653_019068 [Populus alba x Populus x berolinensis]
MMILNIIKTTRMRVLVKMMMIIFL